MDKQLASDSEQTEFVLKIKVFPMQHPRHPEISGYGVVLVSADGTERENSFIHATKLDALEAGAGMLSSEARNLLKTLQEIN